ncbi:hypothetical protein FIBSPDRAFT_1052362 [Athelia psychrophila]|uniref:NACHT domain-containing protein n=1 Tax=Athelia psychrophila TaxID=1759441 RepID=A0A165XHB8_9AGAM|nr:hypothetical protein FIBSPDRAFT_1052362 [Fibularhizoctonia sp. CBS 109695]
MASSVDVPASAAVPPAPLWPVLLSSDTAPAAPTKSEAKGGSGPADLSTREVGKPEEVTASTAPIAATLPSTSRSWGKSKAKSKAKSSPPPPSQRSIVLAGVSSPTVATSSALQVPATLFLTNDTSDHSIVNNVNGDQHVVYEVNATPPAPHALDLLRILDPIPMNAASRPRCLKGTRERILQSLSDNLTAPSAAAKVLWLHGMAGSGKSTIATTIAEHFHKCGQRGAFLFFDRNSPAQSGPDGVIRTLAHQLALSNDILRNAICDAIERDPQIATTTLTLQFSDLIMTPLRSCASQIMRPIVIILDAFDECGDAQSRKALLHLLIKHLPTLPHQFRFLITGRPELDLNNAFCSQPGIISVSLGAAEWSSAADVLRYIEHEIDELYQARRCSDELPLGWPGKPKVQDIGARADDSFIWAATAILFLYAADDVDERLQMLLSINPFTLADLYATALWSAGNWDPREQSTPYCQRILGAVVVGRIALTDDMIVDILGLENAKSCRLVLRRLSCLLQWSEGLPIRTLHASFADYPMDAGSCGDQPWFVDEASNHVDFATGCLRVMKRFLRFNICGLETSHLRNRDVPDLAKRVQDSIPRSLAYACRFWAEHIRLAGAINPQALPLILEFFQALFLYWLEVLSLIGDGRASYAPVKEQVAAVLGVPVALTGEKRIGFGLSNMTRLFTSFSFSFSFS